MSAYGNDCHFYYNTTCTKGENCVYRHCEAAKDCMVTCTFWRQGICSKANCPYRHTDLPPESVQRSRQGIPCYWENQPVGCHRHGCQYLHSKPRPPGVPTVAPPLQNQPIVSESQLPDTSIPPPIFGQGLPPPVSQTLVPIPGAPIIPPVIVQFSDSEVESDKNSPVKSMSGLNRQPVVTASQSQIAGTSSLKTIVPQTSQPIPTLKSVPTSESIPTVKPTVANMPDLDYFIGKPFLNKPRSPPRYYDASSDSRYSNSRSPSPRGRSISPRRRWSRSPSPRRSRSPRRRSPYLRDRSRSPRRWSPRRRSPSPRRRSPTRNLIFRPQDRYQQSHRPVRDRLNREENYPSTSSSREPDRVQAPKTISLSKIKDNTDTDDNKIKVKSLEEIQRAKALLSMGLVELQSGKIVKVGEINKNKEQDNDTKENDKEAKTTKIVKKSTIKVKKPEQKIKLKPKVKKVVVKKVEPEVKVEPEEEEQNEESSDEIIDERQDEAVEETFDDGDDDFGEEPEIDICEASEEFGDTDSQEESEEESSEEEEVEESEEEPVQYTQDIRRTVRKEDIEVKPPRKRKVIVDEEERKEVAKGKVSIHSRLGRKLDSTEKKIPKPQNSRGKVNVKSRLDLKKVKSDESLNNSNNSKGNKLSSGGIKSRLGAGAKVSSSKSDVVIPDTKKIVLKRTIKSTKEEDAKKEVVKRRKWNTGSVKNRLGDNSSETNTSDNELKKIVIVRHIGEDSKKPIKTEKQSESTSNENKSQIKSTLSRINRIIENKRETQEQGGSDTGGRKKEWNKLSVWSSRVAESIAAVKPTKKESDIDIFDSSSNDSLPVELKQSIREPRPSKKGPKHEMPRYVPPARKRTVTSYDDHEADSPPKKLHTKKSEPESIKTYSQIMEEKRRKLEKQREKKQKSEEKAKRKKITPIVFSDKENDNILYETKEMSTNKQPSPTKVDLPVTKPTLLDSFSFTLTEAAERPTEAAERPTEAAERPSEAAERQTQFDKVDSSSEHIELLSTLVPDSSTMEMDDILEITPTKTKSDDKWLEFTQEDLDMTGGETADDDDLLREIDELLA